MNSEVLAIKLLDLTEGRETPESWRSWWDEHEPELENLLSRGEFLKLKPCRHDFRWVPVLTSQKGAIAILEKSGTAFEVSNLYLKGKGIHAVRQTVYGDLQDLILAGVDIVVTKSTQNQYFIGNRLFE